MARCPPKYAPVRKVRKHSVVIKSILTEFCSVFLRIGKKFPVRMVQSEKFLARKVRAALFKYKRAQLSLRTQYNAPVCSLQHHKMTQKLLFI